MAKTIVVGHKNPDVDSVISAILVAKFSKKILGYEAEARVAGDLNNETKFILNLAAAPKPKMLKKITTEDVVLVDTTEPSQIVEGLTEDNLVGILDHHNLGGLKTSRAIYVRIDNIGCTCSLIYKIMGKRGIKVDKKTALMLLGGIVSDTLNLTSPTTTSQDKVFVKELAAIAKIDLKQFVIDQFAAKSSLKGIALNKVIEGDYKEFEMGKEKVGIGVWETTDPQSVNASAGKLMDLLLEKKINEKLNYILFGVVDILKNSTYCYVVGEPEAELVKTVFGVETKDRVAFMPGVVSRKKQLVPPLVNHFTK